MAYTATQAHTGATTPLFERISTAFLAWMERVAERRVAPFRAQIKALHALSDAELAELGLERADIELHVFSRLNYC